MALGWIRGDRRGGLGGEISEAVLSSSAYWNEDSGKHFDIVFPGWGSEGGPHAVFDYRAFIRCKNELEGQSKWRYSGGTDFLVVHFEVDTKRMPYVSEFALDEAIPLRIEELIGEGKILNLDHFVQELINRAKDAGPEGAVLEISAGMVVDRGRRAVWDWVSKTFLKDVGRIYNEMRPFAVCDLRKL